MYYEGTYKVKAVTRSRDGETFDARQHIRTGSGKYRHIEDMPAPEGVDLEPDDVVRLRIENHSVESGYSNRSWALDRFIGFPYDRERGWDYFEGLDL